MLIAFIFKESLNILVKSNNINKNNEIKLIKDYYNIEINRDNNVVVEPRIKISG